MAGGFPLCLAGRRLVHWFGQRDWQNVWLTIGWWEGVDSKIDLSLLIDWLHGWRLPSLLSWSVVGSLVWAKRLTECLADYWWVGGCRLKNWLVFTDWLYGWRLPSLLSWLAVGWLVWAKRLTESLLTIGWWEGVDSKMTCLYWLSDYMAGGYPLCLAGRWLVDWFGQIDWQNVWLTIGWWEGVD